MRIIRKIKNRIREMVQQHHKRKLHKKQLREKWANNARRIAEELVKSAQKQPPGKSSVLTSDWILIRYHDFDLLPEGIVAGRIGKELSKVTKSYRLSLIKPSGNVNPYTWRVIRADITLP